MSSAKSTPTVSKTETTTKRSVRDYSEYTEAAETHQRLSNRYHAAGDEIENKRKALASAASSADRAVALLEDPDSPMPQSEAFKFQEMQEDRDAIARATGEAGRKLQELREQASHEQWALEKPAHDELMANVTAKIGELLASFAAEQEFIRDFGARGFVISNSHLPLGLHQMSGPLRQIHTFLVGQQATAKGQS